MSDEWDADFSSTAAQQPATDWNNNMNKSEKTGFGGGFGNRDGGDDNERKGFDGERGGGFGGERRGGFGGERRGGFGGGFGGERSERSGGFGERRGGFGGERRGGFGGEGGERRGGFGGEGGERRGGFGGEGGERRGGFGGEGGERRGGFGGEGGERRGGFGGERRGGFGGGFDGERSERSGGFGGERRGGFGGGFGGGFDGERSERSGGFGGERRGGFGGEGGERRGGFGGEGGERRGGFGGRVGNREGGEGGVPGEGEKERERYIPVDVEDTETTLFKNFETGVNFSKQSEIAVNISGEGSESIVPLKHFNEAKLTELLMENVIKSGYTVPTPVQKYAIPAILEKRDLMACAQTGSGKTAAFLLPIMTNILNDGIESSEFTQVQTPQALVLSPTRELAMQIFNESKKFSYRSMIKSGILYGGVDTGYQLRNLEKGCNILVATPGRLMDMLEKGKISLEKVKYFVLDEADRMMSMNFEKDIRTILKNGGIKEKGAGRVTLMFSATFPAEIQQLAQDFMQNYVFLAVGVVGGANSDVTQSLQKVTRFEKRDKCVEIINDIGNDKIMIFVEKKVDADRLGFYLCQKGYPTTTLHGDRLQSQRETALNSFKSGKDNIIVCTAVGARGLDIEKVSHVINFDMPHDVDEYVHRIGRTGRCGNLGKAISFFDPTSENDRKLARPLVRILTQAQQEVPQWLNEIAEDNVGSAFMGDACKDDLRGQFGKLTVAEPVATATVVGDDDEWE